MDDPTEAISLQQHHTSFHIKALLIMVPGTHEDFHLFIIKGSIVCKKPYHNNFLIDDNLIEEVSNFDGNN
jgi:hypothetical protein